MTLPANVDPETNWLLDDEGNPVTDDATGEFVVWAEGMPTNPVFYKFATAPTLETTWRFEIGPNLNFFVRKPGISQEAAWSAFTTATYGEYPDAVQTEYTPTLIQLTQDWNAGLGAIIYPD